MNSRILLIICLSASLVLAWDNTPPIPGYHTGYTEGKNRYNIEIEAFYDLLAPETESAFKNFLSFLDMPFADRTVRDSVKVTYNFIPTPFYNGEWIAAKVTPMIIDKCNADPSSCLIYDYIRFCYENRDLLLKKQDNSTNELI